MMLFDWLHIIVAALLTSFWDYFASRSLQGHQQGPLVYPVECFACPTEHGSKESNYVSLCMDFL